jgi:hypothetical protein
VVDFGFGCGSAALRLKGFDFGFWLRSTALQPSGTNQRRLVFHISTTPECGILHVPAPYN